MTVRRALAALALSLAAVGAMVAIALRALVPEPPPPLAPEAPAYAPLTKHLLFVIVDGLRHDVAVDPGRMPHMAEAMRTRSSARILSGPVSMTSSAVLAYGTGQRGDLDQIVFNEIARPTPYNHLLQNAKAAGLRTAVAGDIAWLQMYPGTWDQAHPDPLGVAIDVDYSAEIFAAAHEQLLARPNLMVAHFVPPDHMGHAYGVTSDRYGAFIRGFDAELNRLLAAVPADTTVVVTSDHGATDRGKHGADAPIQRLSPIYAYGPGIRPGYRHDEPLDQLDVSATLARLLGIAQPAHAQGHVLARWLDLEPEGQARAACDSLARLGRYADRVVHDATEGLASACDPARAPEDRIHAAEARARALTDALHAADPAETGAPWLALAALLALAAAAAWGAPPKPALALAFLLLLGGALYVMRHNENLPWHWPNIVRGVHLGAFGLVVVSAVAFPRRAAALLERPAVATVAVGLLLVSFTRYTQLCSWILVAGAALALALPPLRRRLGLPARSPLGLRALAAVALAAAVAPLGLTEEEFLPRPFVESSRLVALVALALVLFVADRLSRRRRDALEIALAVIFAVATLALGHWRSTLPSALGLAAWVGLPAAAVVLALRGRKTSAELALVACFAAVGRMHEVVFLLAVTALAESLGEAAGAALPATPRLAHVAALVVLLFALGFVQRMGLQSGLDFTHFDWGAGTFDARGAGYVRIGSALATKYFVGWALVLYAVLDALPGGYRDPVARALCVTQLARSVALLAMLFVCRRSFWSSFRVLGDLPHAYLAVVAAAAACVWVARRP
jgi:hypothetical protein